MKLNIERIEELGSLVYLGALDDKACDEVIDIIREFVILNKALELACEELDKNIDYCIATEFKETCACGKSLVCKECWAEYYLQKAREAN